MTWIVFSIVVVAGVGTSILWLRRHNEINWIGDGYSVSIRRDVREIAWVEYREAESTLTLRAEYLIEATKRVLLTILIDNELVLAPDYAHSLTEARIEEIRSRICTALDELKIEYSFVRLGWTSKSADINS